MRNKKGFTLIELLAVIVILAVIALIATPIIMNVINDAKKGAAKDSAYAIIGAAGLEMSKNGFNAPVTYTEQDDLNYKGTKPDKMNLEINTKGKSKLSAFIDGYCVVKDYSEEEVTIDDALKTVDTCVNGERSNIIVDIKDGLIPVMYDESGNTVKADVDSKWYDYSNQVWANAVSVTESSRSKYQSASSGTQIAEADILGYYVYIPRYRYKLWNAEYGTSNEQEIEIEFERKTTTKSNGSKNGEWLTHPAFTFGSSELNGIWVGKFEMTGTSTNPTNKPNQKSLKALNNKDMFDIIKSMESGTYGLSSYDVHMMKNMEWGAVAYFTNSKYGRCTNGTCSEVWINNVNTGTGELNNGVQWDHSITGCSGTSADASIKNNMTACEAGRDYKNAGVNASTTGNIYGVYDMNGGAWDRMMAVLTDASGAIIYLSSGFNASNMPDEKYYDKYELTTNEYDFNKGKLGDATREVIKIFETTTGGWYKDYSYMPIISEPWFFRGGGSYNAPNAGIFNSGHFSGATWAIHSSRAVLTLG